MFWIIFFSNRNIKSTYGFLFSNDSKFFQIKFNKKLIRNTQERITICSLYLGNGKMEELLVEELLKALRKNKNLKITILLDRGRGKNLKNYFSKD